MEICINLNDDDLDGITLKCRYITDRKNTDVTRRFFRVDMFWVESECAGKKLGAVSIEPDLKNPENFYINNNWCKVCKGMDALRDKIREWFLKQPEYKKQVEWTKDLISRMEK